MNNDNICFGIDFGTTNSCISFWYENNPIIIKDIDDSDIIPTVIEITDNKKIIGQEAYKRKEIFEKLEYNNFVVYEIKKLIGKKYSELDEKYINLLAYQLESDENDNINIVYNKKKYRIEEMVTHIFMSFYYLCNNYLKENYNVEGEFNNVIISVPARFNDNQRELIKTCATHSGFNVIRLLNEPTAASLCYGIENLNSIEEKVIVFDFGGGTLDISLLRIFENDYEVIGSSGNSNLGGSDFDRKLMEYCISCFIEKYEIKPEDFLKKITEQNLQKLKYLTEKCKISLSDNLKTKVIINNFFNEKNLEVSITREDLNLICKDLISLMIKPINELLGICEIDKCLIDQVVMVGGMTKMPIIINNIELYFQKEINCSIDPNTVVSIGASRYGYCLLNQKDIEDRLLLIDRTSLSIGLEASGGIMDIFIKRGTIIPVKKVKKYTTDMDDMDEININIFEGERKFTKDNIVLGDFKLTGIEKQKRGIPEIQITFSIDHNGIINIKAEDLNNTFNKKSLRILGNKQNLNEEELSEIIEKAKLMDKRDRIDKEKKQSYNNIIYESRKIIDNLNNKELKADEETRETVIDAITELLLWIQKMNYSDIELDKYRDIRKEFKQRYSIFLIHNTEPVKYYKGSDEIDDNKHMQSDKNDGVKIFDDEENIKKYATQLNYMKLILEEYNQISLDITELRRNDFNIDTGNNLNFIKDDNNCENIKNVKPNNTDNSEFNNLLNDKIELDDIEIIKDNYDKNNIDLFNNIIEEIPNKKLSNKNEVVNLLDKLCLDVKTICNDFITVFLVDNTLKPEDIDNNCMKIHEVDCIYKDTYVIYKEDIELLLKINKMLENKEKFYLEQNNDNNEDEINKKLDIIIMFFDKIHKYQNNYEKYTNDDLNQMIKIIDKI